MNGKVAWIALGLAIAGYLLSTGYMLKQVDVNKGAIVDIADSMTRDITNALARDRLLVEQINDLSQIIAGHVGLPGHLGQAEDQRRNEEALRAIEVRLARIEALAESSQNIRERLIERIDQLNRTIQERIPREGRRQEGWTPS